MRGHHQEAHVIDDVRVGQERAVVPGGAAELREQIVAAAFAPQRYLPIEIVDDQRRARARRAPSACPAAAPNDRDRCRDHGDEGALDRIELRTKLVAEERGRREIERQLLDRRVEFELAPAWQVAQALGDAGIELIEIRLHRSRFERDRQRAPVQAVLVEIEQHEPAGKQPAKQDVPTESGREQFLAVEQNELVGFRTEQRNVGLAERAAAIYLTVTLRPPLDEPLGSASSTSV